MHQIADKAEIAIYMGGFGRDCGFDARAEDDAVVIRLIKSGSEKREAAIHFHHFLLAGILDDLARSLGERAPIDAVHRQPLLDAARRFAIALERVSPSPAG